MDSKKILIASGDKEELASVSEYLKDKGFETLMATDGAAALEISLNERPSAAVIEIDLPVIDGERIFQILRNNPHTTDISFVFLSSESREIKGFRREIDSLLLKPVKNEEIFRRITGYLSAGKGRMEAGIGDKEIEGRLSHISLGDLLQILHLNRKEGVLKVSYGEKKGFIYMKEGAIYNAVIDGMEKEKALFRLLTWHDGKFEFSPQPIDMPQKIHRSAGNLLMEGMRQYDEWNKAKEQLPKPDSQIRLKVDISSLPKGLKPIIYEVLFLVEYYPVIGELVDHCTFPDYEVYQTLAGLMRKGVLGEAKDKGLKGKGQASAREILTSNQALKIREKAAHRWQDMEAAAFGKILMISTSDNLIMNFVDSCKGLPGFSINRQFITSPIHREKPLGDIASLKLYGGMEAVLIAMPLNERMQPMWSAFSRKTIGMMILCDKKGVEQAKEIAAFKNYILSIRRIPALHIFVADNAIDKRAEEGFKKLLGMKRDEPMFAFEPMNIDRTFQIWSAFFGCILKDEYIAA